MLLGNVLTTKVSTTMLITLTKTIVSEHQDNGLRESHSELRVW